MVSLQQSVCFHVGADGAHSVVAVQEPAVVGLLSTGEKHIICNLLLAFCPFIHPESISQPRDCRPPGPGRERFSGAPADKHSCGCGDGFLFTYMEYFKNKNNQGFCSSKISLKSLRLMPSVKTINFCIFQDIGRTLSESYLIMCYINVILIMLLPVNPVA